MPTRQEIKAKATEIRQWFREQCDVKNQKHRAALQRAAIMLYHRQTMQEQDTGNTIDRNGVGFNGCDADFGTRIAKWGRGIITERMAFGARKMLTKYSRQLAEIALTNNTTQN
jgi:hypothetical protein